MKKTILSAAMFFVSCGYHIAFEKTASATEEKFSSLSQDFKDNKCGKVTCYEVTQAAGVSATMDGGVYKIYKTTRELEGARTDLKLKESMANSFTIAGNQARAIIPNLQEKVKGLEKQLADDTINIAKIYGASPNDVKVIDRESKGIIGGAFGERGGFALVIKKEDNGKVTYVVSLKGTEKSSVNDIFSDLDSEPKDLKNGLKVPTGFYKYAKSIIDESIGKIKEDQNNKQVEVVVTGHSLGGASAVVYSMLLQDNGIDPKNIKTITFAAPPVANGEFKKQYPELNKHITRVQNYGDLVIDLPTHTSPEKAQRLPFLGGKAKEIIENYRKYYLDNVVQEDNFGYGTLLSGKKNGSTLDDLIDLLDKYKNKLNNISDNDFRNSSELKEDYKALDSIIKKYPLVFTGPIIVNSLLSTKDNLFNWNSASVEQVKSQYTAVIDTLTLKNLYDKSGIHINYGNYYTFGKDNQAFKNEYDKAQANKSLPRPSNTYLTDLIQNNITSITQGSSSHIGSASYYLGKSPNQDPKIELEGIKLKSVQENEQYTTPAGSITNLKAPVDVVLNWNQSVSAGQLDLDSHLTGPAGLGDDNSVRFHTYFDSKGSSTTAPYVLLYRDVIPPISSQNKDEQTRIQVLQNGVYRFYVHDYTNREITNSTALSKSGANVTVFNGGQNIPTEVQHLGTQLGNPINVPINQQGNVWRAFELDSRTGVLKPVINAPFGNVSAPASVPTVGQNAVTSGGTVGK